MDSAHAAHPTDGDDVEYSEQLAAARTMRRQDREIPARADTRRISFIVHCTVRGARTNRTHSL